MDELKLREIWKKEEEATHIHGWDFSHINGRYEEENDLPWDYEKIIKSYLKDTFNLLDYDTGGGEFLLSLGHPCNNTSATEGYKPNVQICQERLWGFSLRSAVILLISLLRIKALTSLLTDMGILMYRKHIVF